MDKKVATSEDIERLEGEFQGILENKRGQECIQVLSDKIAEIEKIYSSNKEIKELLAKAYSSRGVVYSNELHKHEKSIEDYDKAIDLKPDYAEAYSNRGLAYIKFGEYKKAMKDYDKAIELKPNSAVFRYNRGAAYARYSEHENALEDYNEAIKLSIAEAPSHEDTKLYRYQSINEYSLQALSQQKLWLSSPRCFNDPLDGDYLYTLLTDEQKKLKEALGGIVITSFQGPAKEQNAEPNCCHTLMWSHYGDSHRGICLQFAYQSPDTLQLPSMLTKVDYNTKRELDFSSVKKLLLQGFSVKDEQWSYESEYRIISHEATEPCYAESGTLRSYKELGLELKAIIFGLKCEQVDRDRVRKLAPENIRFYQIEQKEKHSFLLRCRPIEK